MNLSTKCLLFILSFTTLSGCVSYSRSDYSVLANAGIEYANSIGKMVTVAERTSLDNSSLILLEDNSELSRESDTFASGQRSELQRTNQQDRDFIAIFQVLKNHTFALARYFNLLNQLASSPEPEQTAAALQSTSDKLNSLNQQLSEQPKLVIDDQARARIGAVGKLALDIKIRASLREQIQKSEKTLLQALATHEELFEVLGDKLEHDYKIAQPIRNRLDLEVPLLAQTPIISTAKLREQWIENRRAILLRQESFSELSSARSAAKELKNLLIRVAQGDQDIDTTLNLLELELEQLNGLLEQL